MNVRDSEAGALNVLLIPLIFAVLFFFSSVGFGAWAYISRQDYKNNSDQKARQAADIAARQMSSDKDNGFIEKEKEPLKQYKGPANLGSIVLSYPKTWSGYVDITEGESSFVFHPNVVASGEKVSYAVRVEIVTSKYEQVVQQYEGNIEQGTAKAKVYKLPKMKDVVGMRISGELDEGKQGSVVIMPLRDKTIKISSESPNFLRDFDKIILPNFSYSP